MVDVTGSSTPAGTSGPRALLLAAYDSQLKWARSLGSGLSALGYDCRYAVPSDLRHAVSEQQQTDFAQVEVEFAPWNDLVRQGFESDVVVLALHGPLVSRFSHDLYDLMAEAGPDAVAPVTISGWVGVIIEQITAGYLERFSTDVVAVNCRGDEQWFRETAGILGLDAGNLLLSGLPLLAGAHPERAHEHKPIRTVLFADQPTVPATRNDRTFVYEMLLDYARAHPDRRVLLKPRHRLGEDTFHRMRHHPEELLADHDLPPNFAFDYTPISEQLPVVDLLITVSSTAALEAVGAGVRTAFLADLGIREALGNHIFMRSGLLRTSQQILKDEVGVPDPEWVKDYFLPDDGRSPSERVALRARELSAARRSGEAPATPVGWTTQLFETQHRLLAHRRANAPARKAATRTRLTARRRAGMVAQAVLPQAAFDRLRRFRNRDAGSSRN